MRNRLTLVLAAAFVALVISSASRPGSAPTAADPQSASLMQPVPSDHWAYPAIQELSGGKSSIPLAQGPNGQKPVTRFEMAILLSRIIEKLDAAGGASKLPTEKFELLEKLTREFRADLDSIGADMTAVKARLDDLAKKVEDNAHAPTNGALVKQVFDANQKIDAVAGKAKEQEQKLDSMSNRLTAQSNQIAEGQKRIKVYAEVLAKLLVKVARIEKNPPAAEGGQGLTRANLNDLRGIIKEFVVDFEHRLARVEHTGGSAEIPAASRIPMPDPDPDHILESEPAASESPVGPAVPARPRATSSARQYVPDDQI
ncbi:MAG: hypothetical protein HY303_03260 [Candidatus Wallbacteria bacterium]|nr:hypothetical protein [Candidatus Wallbacteria bacterium]